MSEFYDENRLGEQGLRMGCEGAAILVAAFPDYATPRDGADTLSKLEMDLIGLGSYMRPKWAHLSRFPKSNSAKQKVLIALAQIIRGDLKINAGTDEYYRVSRRHALRDLPGLIADAK